MDGHAENSTYRYSQGRRISESGLVNAQKHGIWESAGSSSSYSTAHRALVSTTNSQFTQTDESMSSTETNEQPASRLLRVYQPSRYAPRKLICSRKITSATLRRYCKYLADNIKHAQFDGEDYWVVDIDEHANSNAVREMVECMDKTPPVALAGNSSVKGMNFPEFLELSIVLWNYICCIKHWLDVAQNLRELDWAHDLRNWTPDRHRQWLFVALVFDWPDVFEAASRCLIVDCSQLQEELSNAPYMPPEVLGVIWTSRKRYMEDTYNFIRSLWIGISKDARHRKTPLPDAISDDLSRGPTAFDIAIDLPEDLHKILSPGGVLSQVENSIKHVRSPRQHPVIQHVNNNPPVHTSTASSELGDDSASQRRVQQPRPTKPQPVRTSVAAKALKDLVGMAKTEIKGHLESRRRSSMPNSEPAMTIQEVDGICDKLLTRISDFRRDQLLPLDIHMFEALRNQHILPAPS